MKSPALLSASEIADGYSVRPSQYSATQWIARLWSPRCGWLGNVFFFGAIRFFPTRTACQAAIDAAGGAGDARACSWGADGYREDFTAGRYVPTSR